MPRVSFKFRCRLILYFYVQFMIYTPLNINHNTPLLNKYYTHKYNIDDNDTNMFKTMK